MASALAQVYHQIATDLFNAAFVSCWTELYSKYQDSLVKSLEKAFSSEKSPNVPPEISQMLLNLCEFMEHDEEPLPIEIRKLGDISEKCQAYAKALHYKELEFQSSPAACTQSLIHINNQLQQPEAAKGVLIFARQHHSVKQQESWYEKLGEWENALQSYQTKRTELLANDEPALEPTLGCMRCLASLGEWDELAQLADETWATAGAEKQQQIAQLAAAATWNLGQWTEFKKYTTQLEPSSDDGSFYRAILSIHHKQFEQAQNHIDVNASCSTHASQRSSAKATKERTY